MFARHVTKDLSAYCHGELSAERSRRVAEHVRDCRRCGEQLDQIKLGIKLAENIATVKAPDSIWPELEQLLHGRRAEALEEGKRSRKFVPVKWKPLALVSAAAAVILTVVFGWYLFIQSSGPWYVDKTGGGTVAINRRTIADKARIGEGQSLQTDGAGSARIGMPMFGHIDVGPNTLVRVMKTLPEEHRVSLVHGLLHAEVKAPPRLFIVDTPAAVATDLGCKFTLEVDEFGNGRLIVTEGWVELTLRGFQAIVPAEADCLTRVGFGPGTPFFEDSSPIFQEALARLDFAEESPEEREVTLNIVLSTSRKRDTLTLWHLLYRVNGIERERVYERLAGFVPPPDGVTREGVLSLDDKMMQEWWADVPFSWF
ncbi:MAG TPA: zf-HC2 domain-containing protein [Blastocatellia bacterium]|nr:zf-HC2 domain-containing protein [Blastocatellia bacterium]